MAKKVNKYNLSFKDDPFWHKLVVSCELGGLRICTTNRLIRHKFNEIKQYSHLKPLALSRVCIEKAREVM